MWYNIGISMDLKRRMLRRTYARVRYSAAYPTGRERMLEPRNGCARAKGVGLPERSEPEGPLPRESK